MFVLVPMVLAFMLVILKSWGGGWDGILSSLINIASDYNYNNDSDNIFMINIINLTDLELTLTRGDVETIIPPYHIERYTITKSSRVEIQANANVVFVKCDITDGFIDIQASKTYSAVITNFGGSYNSNVLTYVIMK